MATETIELQGLINVIQDLTRQIDALRKENEELRKQLADAISGKTKTEEKENIKIEEFRSRDFLEEYLKVKSIREPQTQRAIRSTLNTYLNFLKTKNIHYLDIKPADVIDYIQYLKQNKYAPKTINEYFNIIRGFYDYIINEEHKADIKLLRTNPLLDVQYKPQEEIPRPGLKPEQALKIIEMAYNRKGKAVYGLIMELLVSTGMRIGELLELRVKDVDLKERIIYIKTSKTGVPRMTTYPLVLRNIMTAWLSRKHPEEKLFNMDKHTVNDNISKLAEQANVEVYNIKNEKVPVTSHMFRKCFAYICYINNVPDDLAKAIQGHKITDVHSRYYVDPTKDPKENIRIFKPINDKITILNQLHKGHDLGQLEESEETVEKYGAKQTK